MIQTVNKVSKPEKFEVEKPSFSTIDYYLKTSWQEVVNKYNQIATQYGITQAMGYVLINVRKEGSAVSEIAGQMGVKSTSLSRLLTSLEELGLIYREVNCQDKRSVKVFLTSLGVEKRKLASEVVLGLNAYIDQFLSCEEREILINVLNRIQNIVPGYHPGKPHKC